jgi:hypothetical protein
MATPRTGRPHGGARPGAGRPKGSKTKIYRPHVEAVLALDGIMPKQVLLDVMRRHYGAQRYDEAARVAAMVAPFCHPRLSNSTVEVKPSLMEYLKMASDEELAAFAEEAKAELAAVEPKGRA